MLGVTISSTISVYLKSNFIFASYPAFEMIMDHKAMTQEVSFVSKHLATFNTRFFVIPMDHAVVGSALLKYQEIYNILKSNEK